MNLRTLRVIALKDLREARQNRVALVAVAVLPLFLCVLLPLVCVLAPQLGPVEGLSRTLNTGPIANALRRMPALAALVGTLDPIQAWIAISTGYLFAPLMLIMPLMVSTTLGAESFVGEKERKTIEALLYTPASDSELFLAKVLAATIPATGLSWLCFALYGAVVNVAGWPVMGRLWFPPLNWWPLMLWVTPAFAALGVALTVLISTRVRTFMEAYQLSGSLVLVVLLLLAGQLTGFLFLGVGATLAVGALLWAIDIILIRWAIRIFSRERLLASL
ncbi:MAG: ABC transporter permease subunit [Deltaproteobacteria bacterium]|nr:ABC transporter permease subunit [Deltaproteobacteria bacterium]